MISESQNKEIVDYLVLNKLPLDILIEVKDHMTTQILEIQSHDNISFEKAFFETKVSWEKEFKMTRYFMFYPEQIPVIVKKIVKSRYNSIFKKAFCVASVFFVINLLSVYIATTQEVYTTLFRIQNSLFLIIPIALLVYHYKLRKYYSATFKYRAKSFYTMYQQNIGLMITCLCLNFQIFLGDGKYTYQFFKTDIQVGIIPLLITVLTVFLSQTFVIFGIVNFLEHKKTLSKIQNFISVSES